MRLSSPTAVRLAAAALAALCAAGCSSSSEPPADSCVWRGQVYPVGEKFPAGDGCNTCECSGDLSVTCTEAACPDADPTDTVADAATADAAPADAAPSTPDAAPAADADPTARRHAP